MGEAAVAGADVDELREEVRRGFADMRREVDELRWLLGIRPSGTCDRRPLDEKLAGVGRMDALAQRILQRRGGQLMPPIAEEIARAREERTAQVLREPLER